MDVHVLLPHAASGRSAEINLSRGHVSHQNGMPAGRVLFTAQSLLVIATLLWSHEQWRSVVLILRVEVSFEGSKLNTNQQG